MKNRNQDMDLMPHYSQLEQALIGLRSGITMLKLVCSSETIEMNSTTWTSGTQQKWTLGKTTPQILSMSRHMCKMASSYWDWKRIGIIRSQTQSQRQSQSQNSLLMNLKKSLASIMTCQLHKTELLMLQSRKLPEHMWHRFEISWKALLKTQPIIIHNEI